MAEGTIKVNGKGLKFKWYEYVIKGNPIENTKKIIGALGDEKWGLTVVDDSDEDIGGEVGENVGKVEDIEKSFEKIEPTRLDFYFVKNGKKIEFVGVPTDDGELKIRCWGDVKEFFDAIGEKID